MAPFADRLMNDVIELQKRIVDMTLPPEKVAGGAAVLLDDAGRPLAAVALVGVVAVVPESSDPSHHLDLVGRPASHHGGASRWSGFDHRVFYRVMAHELAERGL